ncbi:MAG: hypothetical protein ABI852_12580, partial [Gemmatimonadaceae bacterium]
MRAPLTPLKAFLHDAAALGRADSPGSNEDPRLSQWLSVAQAAERLAALPADHREEYVARLSTNVLQHREGRPTQTEGDGRAPTDALGQLAERIRLDAEDMEKAGCFEMARTTVSFVCQMLARAPLTNRLLATAHLGRVNRQIGDLDAAVDCYSTVTEQGHAVADGPVTAHGYIGLGNIAHARGNRPQQEVFFEKALGLAAKGSPQELSAHQGLMIAATAQNHLADALLHGWRAHDLAPPESIVQFQILGNLAGAALRAGFYEAALNGYEFVIGKSIVHDRLVACGRALMAAAHCRPAELDRLEAFALTIINGSTPPFDVARFFLWAAEARQILKQTDFIAPRVRESLRIANQYRFNEISMKAEALLAASAFTSDRLPTVPSAAEQSNTVVRAG